MFQYADRILKDQARNAGRFHADAKDLVVKAADVSNLGVLAQLAFLFNPYVIAACAGRTTTVIANFALALFLYALLEKKVMPACFFLAFATYQGLYQVMLLAPLCLMVAEDDLAKAEDNKVDLKKIFVRRFLPVLVTFGGFLAGFLWMSFHLMGGSWSFLAATYGFVLSVPELTPNMGLFWYFFTEMFDHFRTFFTATFQINAFIYVAPLSIRLRRSPFLLAFALITLTAIFKSYPSYGDVGFYLALLPLFQHLFPFTKQLFIVGSMLMVTTVLGPLVYHLWIYNGSANANYFFAINLVFGTAQIFLVTDILLAHVKREFYLFNGYKELFEGKNSKDGPKLVLK